MRFQDIRSFCKVKTGSPVGNHSLGEGCPTFCLVHYRGNIGPAALHTSGTIATGSHPDMKIGSFGRYGSEGVFTVPRVIFTVPRVIFTVPRVIFTVPDFPGVLSLGFFES